MIYEPVHAQAVAENRKQNAWLAKQPLKNKKIYAYVFKKLTGGWSPEQISGRLREEDHPGDPTWQICHETIYQFIYKKKTDQTKQGNELPRSKLRGITQDPTSVDLCVTTYMFAPFLGF